MSYRPLAKEVVNPFAGPIRNVLDAFDAARSRCRAFGTIGVCRRGEDDYVLIVGARPPKGWVLLATFGPDGPRKPPRATPPPTLDPPSSFGPRTDADDEL